MKNVRYTILLATILVIRFSQAQPLWQQIDGLYGNSVVSMAVDSEDHLYASTDLAVYKSIDQGNHWEKILNEGAFSICIDSQQNIYLASWSGNLLKSVDGGTTFSSSFILPGAYQKLFKLDNGTLVIVSLVLADYQIYASSDEGANWTLRHTTNNIAIVFVAGNSIFVGGEDGVLRSDDEGQTFIAKNNGIPSSPFGIFVQSLVGEAGGILYRLGNENVYRSSNNGDTWTDITGNLSGFLYGTLVVNQNHEILLFDPFTNKTHRRDGAGQWIAANQENPPKLVATGMLVTNAWLFQYSYYGIVRISPDGAQWTPANTGIAPGFIDAIALVKRDSSIMVDHLIGLSSYKDGQWSLRQATTNGDPLGGTGDLYYSGNKNFYSQYNMMSDDLGQHWTHSGRYLQTARDSLNGLYQYYNTQSGASLGLTPKLYYSDDFGKQWEEVVTDPLPDLTTAYKQIGAGNGKAYICGTNPVSGLSQLIEINPQTGSVTTLLETTDQLFNVEAKDGSVYVRTTSFTFLRTDDRGATWINITPPSAITFYELTGRVLWAGSQLGYLSYSLNKGDTWINVNLEDGQVSSIAVGRDGFVYAGVIGLGLMKSVNPMINPSLLDPPVCQDYLLDAVIDTSICEGDSYSLVASGASTYSWSPAIGLSGTSTPTVIATPAATTTYEVSGEDAEGCMATAHVTVTVINRPSTPIIDSQTVGAEIQLTSSIVNGNQWFKDGVALIGQTGPTLEITETGIYSVQVIEDGCLSEMSEPLPVVVTGLDGSMRKLSMRVSPNPAETSIVVSLPGTSAISEASLSIKDITGRSVLDRKFHSEEIRVDISLLTSGCYILGLTTNQGMSSTVFFKR